jgi:hypothetical protein
MSKARFARRCVEHRPPRCRDNGRCSPVLYGRGAAAQHEGAPSCDRSGSPWRAASNAHHKMSIPGQYCRPSDALFGHIVAWVCGVVHEVGSGRDIESQLSGAFVTRFQRRPLSAPKSRTGLVDRFSFERSLPDPAPWDQTSSRRSLTKSQACSLLSIARLKRARSRHVRAISKRTRMDRTCLGWKGFFWPTSNPLSQGRGWSTGRASMTGSSAIPPSASL